MFVDNSDNVYTAKYNTTRAATMWEGFQDTVNCWEGILRATGGGLEHSKTFYYALDYKWTGDKWEYMSKEDLPGTINIRKFHTDERVELNCLEPNESALTLGVHLVMDGNQEGHK